MAVPAREFGEKEKMEMRTEQEGKKRREMADLLVLPKQLESWQNSAGFSGKTDGKIKNIFKKRENTGPITNPHRTFPKEQIF